MVENGQNNTNNEGQNLEAKIRIPEDIPWAIKIGYHPIYRDRISRQYPSILIGMSWNIFLFQVSERDGNTFHSMKKLEWSCASYRI